MIPKEPKFPCSGACLVLCCFLFCVGCGQSSKKICQQRQGEIWDAARSYYLEHKMKPSDLIEPKELADFFGPDDFPHCPDGTNGYAPFRLFDGPRCPHPGSGHTPLPIPATIIKIRENEKR